MTTSPASLTRLSALRLRQRLPRPRGRRPHARRHRAPGQRQGDPRAAAQLGAPIVRIALTHAHGDHIGSLDALAARAARRRGPHLRARRAPARQGQVPGPGRAAGQAARRLPGRQDPADAHARARRPRRLARGRRRARPHARPRRVPRHARRHAAVRRRVHHAQRRRDHLASPTRASRCAAMATWNRRRRARERRARCARWTRRAWPPATARSSRARARRWTPRSPRRREPPAARGARPRPRVAAAAAIADAEGLDAVTLARVAGELGVRSPSLYNHVDGPATACGAGSRCWPSRELGARLREAAIGRAGDDALRGDRRRPTATTPARTPAATPLTQYCARAGDAEVAAAAAAIVAIVLDGPARLRPGRRGRDPRGRAASAPRVHGFVSLETGGGFGIAVDVDESFRRLVSTLAAGFARP